jgi:hypothetical protein
MIGLLVLLDQQKLGRAELGDDAEPVIQQHDQAAFHFIGIE